MIRCLIVDDEPPAVKVLRSHISQVKGLEVAGVCHNAICAHEIIHEKKIELIFLDIRMPKLSGLDFLKSLSHPPLVIFVTAYREFAVDGFELDAADYLVKPVSFERFLKSISKVKKLLGHDISIPETETPSDKDAFVYVRVDKHMEKILLKDIEYIESWRDYVMIFLSNNNKMLAKRSISSMQSLLPEKRFLRIHRSYLVSREKITGYNNSHILLGKMEIPIGRFYKQQVMNDVMKI